MAAIATPTMVKSFSRILVASADSSFRKRLISSPTYAESLSEEAVGGAHALAKLGQVPCQSVLLDRHLPDLDAAEVAHIIRKRYPKVEVEIVDSKAPAFDAEPVELQPLDETKSKSADQSVAKAPLRFRQPLREAAQALPGMIGSSRAMQQVYRLARLVAPRDTTVLITGGTGTGKELVAQAIHQLSPRAGQSFVVVNCAAIPETLLEAELFGHARGAFTGALQSRVGRIQAAQGGTLFLDEVAELPLSMQAKLLRFLQDGEVQRLGSSELDHVDVRVVCATNVRLTDLVQAKLFRQDLYYRLVVFPITLPALRERTEDIAALAAHFLEQLSSETETPPKYLTASALALLQQSDWAGNVRELQHALERAFILAGNDECLGVEHFQHFGDAHN
jgi:transcriptional regulator with GAF, ATPase, and Fis domain